MIDRFSKWQRPGGKPANKPPLEVKWRSTHAGAIRSKEANSSLVEAERDTVIFRWTLLIIFLLAFGAYLIFFMHSVKPD